MDNPEKLATLVTKYTGRRRTAQKHKNKFNLPGSFDWTCQTYKNRKKDVIYQVRYIVKDIVI